MTDPAAFRYRKRVWLLLRSLLIAGLVTIASAAVAWRFFPVEWDAVLIRWERSQRFATHAAGGRLKDTPDFSRLAERLAAKGLTAGAPVFMRIFKREFELELWMVRDGRFELFATYPVCRWSGALGPKLKEGDRQAPEGFYSVDRKALNPNSRWHRSFNLGFPNAYDQAHGRTGSFLMVHGGCLSVGCYAMTDAAIDEIWTLVTRAFDAGQARFQVQVFPFRMTEPNLRRYVGHSWHPFWTSLKAGYDLFERDRIPPTAGVCGQRYAFTPGGRDVTGPVVPQCPGQRAAPDSSPRP